MHSFISTVYYLAEKTRRKLEEKTSTTRCQRFLRRV